MLVLPNWPRVCNRAFVSRLVHGTNTKKVIVLGLALYDIGKYISGRYSIRPFGGRRVAIDHFISGDVGVLVSIPFELGVVVQAVHHRHIFWASRGGGQTSEGDQVNSRNIRDVIEVYEFRRIAIENATFGTDVLVLVRVIFIHFGNTNGRKPAFEKGNMIAASAVTISAIDHPNLKIFQVSI